MKQYFMVKIKTAVYMMFSLLIIILQTSCSDNDEPQESTGSETGYENQLAYFESFIVGVDSEGALTERRNGVPLEEFSSDPTELFIGVENTEEAREMFMNWMPDNAKIVNEGNDILFYPTGTKNDSQGEVKFMTANAEDGKTLATITFNDGASIVGVSKINFIKTTAWPDNDLSALSIGEILRKKHEGEWYDFVCIKEASNGQMGIMVAFDSYIFGAPGGKALSEMASKSEGRAVQKIVGGDNWNLHKNNFINAGYSHVFENNDDGFVWFDHWCYWVLWVSDYAIQLKTGHEEKFVNKKYKFSGMYVEYFGTIIE